MLALTTAATLVLTRHILKHAVILEEWIMQDALLDFWFAVVHGYLGCCHVSESLLEVCQI